MLQNAYLLAKIGADPAENEQKFAENLPISQLPYGFPTFGAFMCMLSAALAAGLTMGSASDLLCNSKFGLTLN